MSDGSVQCWGGNAYGQAAAQAGPFIQISAGNLHTCGLKSDGSVACWGWNFSHQADAQAGPFTQISAGVGNTCGVKTNGDVYWGDYESLIYGVRAGPFTQVDVSGNHACALTPPPGTGSRPNGAHCWGSGFSGELNDHLVAYTQITVGYQHNCALLWLTGRADCWGSDLYGQSSPPPDDNSYLQVSAGHLFTCGVQTDYDVACWGYDFYGQVADAPAGKFKQVAAGYGHACAMDDYDVDCWGRNDRGQARPILCLGLECGPGPRRIFAFQGFYPPLEAEQENPTLNTANAGSAAPLKFSLGGAKGLNVIEAGYPASRPLDSDQSAPRGVPEPVQPGGNRGLSYDAQSDTYTYLWKTDKAWAGTCRVLALRLSDGTEHLAAFRFQ